MDTETLKDEALNAQEDQNGESERFGGAAVNEVWFRKVPAVCEYCTPDDEPESEKVARQGDAEVEIALLN